MKTIARIFAGLVFCSFYWIVGCPDHPAPAALGNVLHIRMLVSAATGLPTSVLFDYDFTQPLNKACSATVTSNCVSGFQAGYFSGSGAQLGSWTAVPLPATISSTGPTIGISTPYTGPSSLGIYQLEVQVLYKDGSGAAQQGPVAAAPLVLVPSAVSNVRSQ